MSAEVPPQVRDCLAVASKLDRADLALERQLHGSKWFDYRFVTPKQATLIFKAAYQKVYREKYADNIDTEEAEGVTGIDTSDFAGTKQPTAFWRARQFADALGVPYDIFCEAAFGNLLRSWKRIPYINQLYGKKNEQRIARAVYDYWTEWRTTRLMCSRLPQYREESFRNLPAQIEHRNWVIQEIKNNRTGALAQACDFFRILPIDEAVATFGQDWLDRTREGYFSEPPDPVVSVPDNEFLPSCHSIPGAYEETAVECKACPVRSSCLAGVTAVRDKLMASHGGSDDPKADRRRDQVRRRVALHRAKKKVGPTITMTLTTSADRPSSSAGGTM